MLRQGVSFKGTVGGRLGVRVAGYGRVPFGRRTQASPSHPLSLGLPRSAPSFTPRPTAFTRHYSDQPAQELKENAEEQRERLGVYKKRFEESIKGEQDEAKREQAKQDFLSSSVSDANRCYFFWSVAKEEDFTVVKVQSNERLSGASLYNVFGSNLPIVFMSFKCSVQNAKYYLEKDVPNHYTQYLVTLKQDAQRLMKEFNAGNPTGIVVSKGEAADPEVIELQSRVNMVIQNKTQYVPVVPFLLYPKQKNQMDVNIENKDEFSYFYRDRLQDIMEHSIPPYLVYREKKFLPVFRDHMDALRNADLLDALSPVEDVEEDSDFDRDVKLHAALTEAKKNGQVGDEQLQQIVNQLGVSEDESKKILRDVKTSELLSDVLNEDYEEEDGEEVSSVIPETEEGEEENEGSQEEETTSEEESSSIQMYLEKLKQLPSVPPTLPHYLNSIGVKVPYTADIPQEVIAQRLTELLHLDFFKEFLSLFNFTAYIAEPFIHHSGCVVFIVADPSFSPDASHSTNVEIVQEKLAQLFNVPKSKFDIYWREVSRKNKDQMINLTLTGISINDIVPPFEEETSFNWASYDIFLTERVEHWVKHTIPAPEWKTEEEL